MRKTIKVTRKDAASIYAALQQLGNLSLVCWYPITRNIQALKKITEETSTVVNELINEKALKNPDGTWKLLPGPNKDLVHDFGDAKAEVDKIIEDLENESKEIEVRYIDLKDVRVKNEAESGLPANIMEPLLDVIIFEDLYKDQEAKEGVKTLEPVE